MDPTLMPARPVPPGRILRRELEARGWTQRDLAEILGRPTQVITEIIHGTKQITPETAVALAAAFGTSAELWSNLEADYRLALARQSASTPDDVARKARLYGWVPVREIVKRGWVPRAASVPEQERTVCEFLGVQHIGEEPKLLVSLRGADEASQRPAQRAWVKRVEQLAEGQAVRPFQASVLRESMPSVLAEAATVDGVGRVPVLLRELGIRFVVVPHLPGTRLDGAAAFTREGPVVALTMRFDRIDYFWFTLLHELAHLALGHRGGHLDGEVEEEVVDGEEGEANALASEWLLPERDVQAFWRAMSGKASRPAIEAFAREHRVHPGLVVGRLHHAKLLPFSHLRGLLVKVREQLAEWTDGH